MHAHTYIHTCMHAHAYMYLYEVHTLRTFSINTYIYTHNMHAHTYIHTYIHTCMHACIHVFIRGPHTTHIYMPIYRCRYKDFFAQTRLPENSAHSK